MGIQLSLQHPDLGLVQLPLIVHQLLPVGLQGQHHVVEALRQLAQLILPVPGHMDIQIVLLQPVEGFQQPPDGQRNPLAQGKTQRCGYQNARQNAEKAGGIEQLHGALRKHLGLLQHENQARRPVFCNLITEFLGPGPGAAVQQQLRTEVIRQPGRQVALAGVNRMPVPAEDQNLVGAAVFPGKELLNILPGQLHNQIAQRVSFRTGQQRRPLQQNIPVSGRLIHRLALGVFRREKDAPAGGKGGAGGDAAGGIAQPAHQVVQRVIRQIPAALGGVKQGRIDLGVFQAGKGPGQQTAFLQRPGGRRQSIAHMIQSGHQVGCLGLGVGFHLLFHLNAENLGQQRRADDHGHQGGNQEGAEQPVPEGTALGSGHGATSPSRKAQSDSRRSRFLLAHSTS